MEINDGENVDDRCGAQPCHIATLHHPAHARASSPRTRHVVVVVIVVVVVVSQTSPRHRATARPQKATIAMTLSDGQSDAVSPAMSRQCWPVRVSGRRPAAAADQPSASSSATGWQWPRTAWR